MTYSQGFIRQSPSGKWVGVLKYKDPAGQWRQVTKTLSPDRAEAELALAKWHAEMEAFPTESALTAGSAASMRRGRRTIEEAIRECLAAQLARGQIERSTHDMQMGYAERCIIPELGLVPTTTLTPAAAQGWVDRLCLGMSAGSARIALGVIGKALARETALGRLDANPFAHIEKPARTRPSRTYLPEASVALLKKAVNKRWGPDDPRTCAVALALLAGLRAGECCGLRWRDIDLAAGRIRVTASVGRTRGSCYLKAPKCAASVREFPIVPALFQTLAARAKTASHEMETPPGAHFACGPGEAFADPRRLSLDFARLCEQAGVIDSEGRRATFHQLRHTFATRAVRAGVDVRTLADLMGHSNAEVTLNVYAASGEDAKAAAITRMTEVLGE